MKQEILGVGIDVITKKEAISQIADLLKSENQHYVVTVNPEFIVAAKKNKDFQEVLNKASLAVCDGIGLVLASLGKLKRVTGVELSEEILSGKIESAKVFLLGGTGESAKLVMDKNLKIVAGAETGGIVNTSNWLLDNNEIILKKIIASGANILLVGFGQVKQEMWISHNLNKLPNIKVAIGVGGTFDYLSGNIKRAPKILRLIGLEWLFRFFTQPERAGRIFNATFKFIILVILDKITTK